MSPKAARGNPDGTRYLDVTRAGSQAYSQQDVDTVWRCLQGATPRNPISQARMHEITQVDGRAIRQIIADYAGVRWVLGGTPDGHFVPEYYEDVMPRLMSRRRAIRTALARQEREEAWAEANLPRRQQGLFDAEPEDDADLEDEDEDL